jgi:hypothetical protein
MSRPLRLGLALVALLAALALVLPASLRLLLLIPAFLAGAALERYRRDVGQRTPALRATPAAWLAAVRGAVGWPAALAAAALVALAVVLALPHGHKAPPSGGGSVRAAGTPAPLPAVLVRHERPGAVFRAHGAAFRVYLAGDEAWAREIRLRRPGRGRHWITVGVRARNLWRARFDPTRLSYRLRDRRGAYYVGDFRGGTGPRSLAHSGTLLHGQSALVQLGFSVPARVARATLVFEDRLIDGTQIRVPLPRS